MDDILEHGYNFFLMFQIKGIHKIKIIFKKKLYDCSFLFNNCKEIIEIDLSNFDYSQMTAAESMFDKCQSLYKVNLGKLDFSLCKNFKSLFNESKKLENIDVSHFNTKNSITFEKMFCGCRKLKYVNVSKFNSSKCESINSMFKYCENLYEIDMIKWDLSNIKINIMDKEDKEKQKNAGILPMFGIGIIHLMNHIFKRNSIDYLFFG